MRDLVLHFDSAQIDEGASELCIHLRDAAYPFRGTLHYRVHSSHSTHSTSSGQTSSG